MQLSGGSTFFFWASSIVFAISIGYLLFEIVRFFIRKKRGESLEIEGLIVMCLCIVATIAAIISGIILWFVASGGIRAQNISDDLTDKGYSVASINLSDDQALVVVEDRLQWTYLLKDENGTWDIKMLQAIVTP